MVMICRQDKSRVKKTKQNNNKIDASGSNDEI